MTKADGMELLMYCAEIIGDAGSLAVDMMARGDKEYHLTDAIDGALSAFDSATARDGTHPSDNQRASLLRAAAWSMLALREYDVEAKAKKEARDDEG